MIYHQMTSPEIGELAPSTVAVLPLGSIEQHGNHLAAGTDWTIAGELGRRAEAMRPGKVLLLPGLWCGSSHHHLEFPGALSISSETYIRVLLDLLGCLAGSGFRRIFLLNGHGGNHTPFSEAIGRFAISHPGVWVCGQSYWILAAQELAAAGFMETSRLSHACEYETSMVMAIDTASVRPGLARGYTPEQRSRFHDPTGAAASRVVAKMTFGQLTPHGALGSPELASADKGERLLNLVSRVLVEFLDDFAGWESKEKARQP